MGKLLAFIVAVSATIFIGWIMYVIILITGPWGDALVIGTPVTMGILLGLASIRDVFQMKKLKKLNGSSAICLYGDYKGENGTIIDVYRPKTATKISDLEVRLRVLLRVTDSVSRKKQDKYVEISMPLEHVQVED